MANLAKIFDQAHALRAAERGTSRGEAAARFAKEHGVSLCEAGHRFGISRECVRQKWRDLFGDEATPTQTNRDLSDRRIADLAQRGLTMTEIVDALGVSLDMVIGARERLGLVMVNGNDKGAVTAETKAKILAMAEAGKGRAEIAHATGISYGAVSKHLRGHSTRGKCSKRGASALASETMDRTGCSLHDAAAMFVVSPPALYAYRKRRGLWTVAP